MRRAPLRPTVVTASAAPERHPRRRALRIAHRQLLDTDLDAAQAKLGVWGRLIAFGRTITSYSLSEVAARLEGFEAEIVTILGSAPPVTSGAGAATASPAAGTDGTSSSPGPTSSAQPNSSASPTPATTTSAPDETDTGTGTDTFGDTTTAEPTAPSTPATTASASPRPSPDAAGATAESSSNP